MIRRLVDGCSILAATRTTGVAKNTIQKLTRELGEAVLQYHDQVVCNVKSRRVQCDEVWRFCYAKDKSVPDPAPIVRCGAVAYDPPVISTRLLTILISTAFAAAGKELP